MALRSALAKLLTWESLARLSQIQILKVGYFGAIAAPIVAYLIIELKKYHHTIEFPQTLLIAYIASLFLSFGQFWNELFCPTIIKEHGCLDTYRKNLSTYILNHGMIVKAAREQERDGVQKALAEHFGDDLATENDLTDAIVEKIILTYSEVGEEFKGSYVRYEEDWKKANFSRFPLRLIIGLCYACASSLALAIMIIQFFRVYSALHS